MHDREFEKQVQQKMQELRFQPGADVWARVQADIRRKKRRRPVIFWILFAGLLTGGAWIYLSNKQGNNQQTATAVPAATVTPDQNTNTPSTAEDQPSGKTNTTDQIKKETASSETTIQPTNPAATADKNTDTRRVAIRENTRQQQATEKPAGHTKNGRQPVRNKDANRTQKPSSVIARTPDIVNRADTPKDSSGIASADVHKKMADNPEAKKGDESISKTGDPKTDSTDVNIAKTNKTDLDKSDSGKPDTHKSDSLQSGKDVSLNNNKPDQPSPDKPEENKLSKNTTGNAKKSDWRWGISAGGGVSDLGKQLFQGTSVADFALNPNSGGGQGTGTATIRRPSPIKGTASFNAGAFVSKSIGSRWRLKLGADYAYYSNSIRVGLFVDSTTYVNQGMAMNKVDEYYLTGNSNTYTNGYHFVSIPLSAQWRVNRNQRFGLVWENGISISRLLHTNALHYDGIGGRYYKDRTVLNKTQWMFNSSLLFNLKTKNNLQLYAGPHLQYAFSSMIKNENGNDKHLRYAGLKMMVEFNKK